MKTRVIVLENIPPAELDETLSLLEFENVNNDSIQRIRQRDGNWTVKFTIFESNEGGSRDHP